MNVLACSNALHEFSYVFTCRQLQHGKCNVVGAGICQCIGGNWTGRDVQVSGQPVEAAAEMCGCKLAGFLWQVEQKEVQQSVQPPAQCLGGTQSCLEHG